MVSGCGKAPANNTQWSCCILGTVSSWEEFGNRAGKDPDGANFALSSANRYPKVRSVTHAAYGTAEAERHGRAFPVTSIAANSANKHLADFGGGKKQHRVSTAVKKPQQEEFDDGKSEMSYLS